MTLEELEIKVLQMEQALLPINDSIAEFYKYIPYVYTQIISDPDRIFNVFVPSTREKPTTLLYYVPVKSSKNVISQMNELRIIHGTNSAIIYNIYYEASDGTTKPIQAQAIVPNKLCIFRLQPLIGRAILVNATIEDNARVFQLYVSNQSYFRNNPKIYTDPDNILGSSEELVTQSQAEEIAEQKATLVLEGKLLYGTTDPITALTGKEDGTFYVQVPSDD